MILYRIADEMHGEIFGDYGSFGEALGVLKRWALRSWDESPNLCPCTNWHSCGRHYEIQVLDTSTEPFWTLRETMPIVSVSGDGAEWSYFG